MFDGYWILWMLFGLTELAIYGGIIYLIISFFRKRKQKREAQLLEMQENQISKQEKESQIRGLLDKIQKNYESYCGYSNISNLLLPFFQDAKKIDCERETYNMMENKISDRIFRMEACQKEILETADILSKKYMQVDPIRSLKWDGVSTKEDIAQILAQFKIFDQKVMSATHPAKMLSETSYGSINRDYWDSIQTLTRSEAVRFVEDYRMLLNSGNIHGILQTDVEKALKCIWYFAIEMPFSASDYQKAKQAFLGIFREKSADIIISDLYSKYKLGGEDAIQDDVRWLLGKYASDVELLTSIASSLMWMEAYRSENKVLQHMLSKGLEMSMTLQQRLHALSRNGGKGVNSFSAKSSVDSLYFDASAVAWKESDYIGLFDNLAFQGKSLTYSLAIRDEDKDLNIPGDIQIPDIPQIEGRLKTNFMKEYGQTVTCQAVTAIALSGSGEESLKGIMVVSDDCPQLGILIHVARIGRKFSIKLYTLFMPGAGNPEGSKQQALALYHKISPLTTRWESSLKETMLISVQQLLNEPAQSNVNLHDAPIF